MRLKDICEINKKTYSVKEKWPVIYYLDTQNINKGQINEVKRYNTEWEKMPSRAKRKVSKNDILYSMVRPNQHHYGIIQSEKENFLVSTGFAVITVNENIADPYFIYYFLTQAQVIEYLQNIAEQSTSTYPAIKPSDIEELAIDLPDLEKQKRIGKFLRSIDETINVKKNINDNLEQQSAAIFSDWLETYATSSREVTLDEVCIKVTDGSHFSPKDDPTSSIPMLSVKDMNEYDFNFTSCKHISEEDYQKMEANDCVPKVNDILVAKDGSYLKEIFVCNERRKLAVLSSIAIFRPNPEVIYTEILLAFLKSPHVLQEVRDNYVSGSALPRIVLKDFKKLKFSLPDMQAQSDIADVMIAYRKKIALNIQENQRLEAMRDALLPRLMSGKIDVSAVQL